ncbi:MAG: 50S ribosomal protein L20 [Planctomycetota bacterium]
MPRATSNVATHRRHKRVLKRAKGYWGRRSKIYTVAKESVIRAGVYAFRDRRARKRDFRRLWITRISAATRLRGMPYSQFMSGLERASITLDRKMLAEIAVHEPAVFDDLVNKVRTAAGAG